MPRYSVGPLASFDGLTQIDLNTGGSRAAGRNAGSCWA